MTVGYCDVVVAADGFDGGAAVVAGADAAAAVAVVDGCGDGGDVQLWSSDGDMVRNAMTTRPLRLCR